MILNQYDKMAETDNFVVLDGTMPVNQLQKQMREIVASRIDLKRLHLSMTPRKRRTEQAAAPQVVAPKNNGRPAAAPWTPTSISLASRWSASARKS